MSKDEKQLYIKENNILQLCLFSFSKKHEKETVTEWINEDGIYGMWGQMLMEDFK